MSDLFDDKEVKPKAKKSSPAKRRQIKYDKVLSDSNDGLGDKDISFLFEEDDQNDKTVNFSGIFEELDDFIIGEEGSHQTTADDLEKTKKSVKKTGKKKITDKSKDDEIIDDSSTSDLSNGLDILYNDDDDFDIELFNNQKKSKMKLWQKALVLVICLCLIGASGLAFLLYGPYPNFRQWLITTAMTTMNHQYLAKWFYSDKTIESVLKKNYVVEASEDTDISQVKFVDYSNAKVMYKNKYEKEILTKDKGNDLYKVINIEEPGMRGYLVVIYDPSKVKIATATNMQSRGDMLIDMVSKNNAVIGMNASGFHDPNYNGNGGQPFGVVIKDGKIVSDSDKPGVGGGIIGFNNENKLVLGKMSGKEALQKGIRDGIEFGPYLIVNGNPSFIRGNGGWGTAPRSAIAQRQDGIVLFLVMDGRDYAHGIDGVGMVELTEILMKYGAYNASNLDGGTSSGLVVDGKLINKPVNGNGQKRTREIPDAWIVIK